MTLSVIDAQQAPAQWSAPPKTLGWEILAWCSEYLLQPDGPDAGEPWEFTHEQVRFLLNWYAVDARGRFVYRYGVYRRMKGAGKNPFAASLCAIELVGPCRFSAFDSAGQPVAESHYSSWVQTAAVSRDQTRNAMTLMPALLSRAAIREFGIDLGKEIIYAANARCRMEAVTSSPRALEGGRATFIVMDETQHWQRANEGHAMAEVIARNAAKSRDGASRVLAITNAHAPGEDSVAEHDWEAWQAIKQGISTATGVLYDSIEAPATDLLDGDSLRAGLIAARGDSTWIDVDRLVEEIRDPRTSPAIARRFYLNQIVAEEDRPFDRKRFEQLVRPGYNVTRGALITLGFDGSVNRDHTVLIGTEVASGYQWVVGYWEPRINDDGEVQIPFAEVDETVDDAFKRWQVWRLNADPFYWREYTAKWAGRYGKETVVDWPTNQYRRMAMAVLAYRNAITAGDLTHDGDPRFVAAIGNARKLMQNFFDDKGERLFVLQKERPDSPLKIDAAMAAILSREAYTSAIAGGVGSGFVSIYESEGIESW